MTRKHLVAALFLRVAGAAFSLWIAYQAVLYAKGDVILPVYDHIMEMSIRLSAEPSADPVMGAMQTLPLRFLELIRVPVGVLLLALFAVSAQAHADALALRVQHGSRVYRLIDRARVLSKKKPERQLSRRVTKTTLLEDLMLLPLTAVGLAILAAVVVYLYRAASQLLAELGMSWSSVGFTAVELLVAVVAVNSICMCVSALRQYARGKRRVQVALG